MLLCKNYKKISTIFMPLCCHPKVARQCQTFKTTSLHKFGPPKILFGMNFCYLSHGLSVEFFFQLLANLIKITNHYELQTDWSKKKNQKKSVLVVLHFFLECCNMSSKAHPTQTKTVSDKNDCNPHALLLVPACKTESFLVIYPWCQRHFEDVKTKHWQMSAQHTGAHETSVTDVPPKTPCKMI